MEKLLFIALSNSQERYYHALNTEFERQRNNGNTKDYSGKVVRISKLKGGNSKKAHAWCLAHNLDWRAWLHFKLKTNKSEQKPLFIQKVTHYLLGIEVLRFFDRFKTIYDEFKPSALVVYNGAHYKQQAAISIAKLNKIHVLHHELGCLPDTTAIDPQGVNYLSSVPKDSLFYQNYAKQLKEPLIAPQTKLVARESRKAVASNKSLPAKYIFVPFQVHDDTQVLLHSPWIEDMETLFNLLKNSVDSLASNYSFVVKEHPSDKKTYPQLHNQHQRIIFANGNNTQELIEGSSIVATINSTVGIEALLLNKPVITLGNAFYNIEGLVTCCNTEHTFRNLIKAPDALNFDEHLKNTFFDYLQRHHLISGRPKTFDGNHLKLMAERMQSFLNAK